MYDINVNFYTDVIKCRNILNQLLDNYFHPKISFKKTFLYVQCCRLSIKKIMIVSLNLIEKEDVKGEGNEYSCILHLPYIIPFTIQTKS